MSPYYQQLRAKVGHDLLLCPSVAAVIRDAAGRLLLQQKASDEGWSLPAGAIEPGESPEQTLVREVREETGLMVKPTAVLGVFGGLGFRYTYPNGDVVEYTVVVYACDVMQNQGRPTDPETKALQYFTAQELPPLSLPYPRHLLFEDIR